MKRLTNGIIAVCCLSIVGCNQFTRSGSEGLVFDSDPFTEIDSNQRVSTAQQPPTGRVSVGNLGGQAAPPTYADMQMQQQPTGQAYQQPPPPAAAQSQYAQYNYSPNYAQAPQQPQPGQQSPIVQAGYQPPPNPAGVPQASGNMNSAASRAAAEVAAMIAKRQTSQMPPNTQMAPGGITQASYNVTAPGTATYGSPDPFDPQPGAVPMPPEAQFDAGSQQWELTEADLELPAAPQPNPGVFPGSTMNIPLPTGRATLTDALPAEWEPTPTPPATGGAIPTQPVFSPPATQQNSSTTTPPVPPAVVAPVIQDSTNYSKWRAVRRQ